MKNLMAVVVILIFTGVNLYAEKADLNSLSELQPYFVHAVKISYKYKLHHSMKKHSKNSSFDRAGGISYDDALITEGFDGKDYGKPAMGVKASALAAVAGYETGIQETLLVYNCFTTSNLTSQQRK